MNALEVYVLLNKKIQQSSSGIKNVGIEDGKLFFETTHDKFYIDLPQTTVTKEEVERIVDSKAASYTTAGIVKPDGESLEIAADGTLSISDDYINRIPESTIYTLF